MPCYQYMSELYERLPPHSDIRGIVKEVKEWLIENVGQECDARSEFIHDWAWSLTKYRQECPYGIYFKREEDQMAFRLKFGVLYGR